MPKESNLAILKQIFTPKKKPEATKREATPPPTLPPTPCSLRSTSHSAMSEAPPVYDDASFTTLCDYTEDDGMDIDAYINSIAKAPEEEEGFGEYGYEGLWLWPSEIAKFKSTTLDAYLDEKKAKENDQITHTSYVGGKWFIPIVENNLFLSLYFRDCIRNGSICFFSERQLRWKKFRFIIDWDMDPSPYNAFISRNGMDSITFDRHFAGVIVRALGHLSPAPSFMYAKNPDIPSKIHIYFSRLVRTAEMGNEWIALIRDEFLQTFVTDDSENWEKIFDAAVLQNGRASLRMLGSHSRKRNGVYKVLDLISGEFEDITPIHLAGSIFRTEIEMDDSPYKEGDMAPPAMSVMTSAHSESLKRYTKDLADAKAFPSQSLDFKEVKPGFNGKSYVVNLADRFCSLEGRSHARQSAHMYLFVTRDGTWLKCYNEECRSKNSKLNEPNPPYITDLFPKEIEITEDICGGGESEDETPAAVMARVRKSPFLDKSMLVSLYKKKSKAHNQSAFTAYLNDFVTYVHANDTYGFRENRNDSFTLGKKSTVANKLQRYNAGFDALNIWCENDNRREYRTCIFDTSPTTHDEKVLNLFKGYRAKLIDEQISPENIEPFLYHIREVYCSGNQQYHEYFVRWWAWMFQRGRTGIMAILTSPEKGTGKNILLELIAEHIIGDQYTATTDKITTITQRFNALNAEKVLIIVNELTDATKSKKEQAGTADILKTLIKDRTLTIEKKGVDPLSVLSTASLIGTSQYTVPIKIDDDQRRFFVLKVSDKKKGDGEYFDALAAFVKANADRIYTYLMQVDLKGWHPERNLPQTEYVKQIQAAFRNPIYTYWKDSDWATHDFNAIPTKADAIFTMYKGWCSDKGYTPPNDRWFGRLVREMGYDVKREQQGGERSQWITGSMKDEVRTQYIDTIQ